MIIRTISINKSFRSLITIIKNNLLTIIFCLFTILLVVFSNDNLLAAKEGLYLWANSVVPSLFPFFIATELLSYTNIVKRIERILNPIMKPLFNVSGSGAYAFIMGIISGYPIGAKMVANFRENKICSKEECERLLAFTNNSGPLFIIGTVGINMFFSKEIGLLLFITHVLSSITIGIIFSFWKRTKNISNQNFEKYQQNKKVLALSNLGEILSNSILSAIKTIFLVGGFVVLFSVILSIMKNIYLLDAISKLLNPLLNIIGINKSQFATGLSSGLFEITNGIQYISTIPCKQLSVNIIISSFLLGFGGISILLQVWSIISKTDLSIKPYIIGKLLHGIFAAVFTYIFINKFTIFNLNL